MAEPKIGDPVYFEGLVHRIQNLDERGAFIVSELPASRLLNVVGRSRPRFSFGVQRSDLRWSDELGAWYLWGRLLSKGRGGHGTDERRIVAELRDRGVLPVRPKRRSGDVPAGGEHLNLCCALFRSGIDWHREIERMRKGKELSAPAQAAVEDYKKRYQQKLTEGYADPDADDSWDEGGN